MAAVKSHGIRMDESLDLVLRTLMENGEAMESSCYGMGVGTRRIAETFQGLRELDLVDFHTKTKGQQVHVYSLNRKGELLYCVNRAMHELLGFKGEIDLDEELSEQIFGPLLNHYLSNGTGN